MKRIIIMLAALALAGCETVRAVAPTTVAAFEEEGLLAAADVFTQHIVIRCEVLDGQEALIDVTAEAFKAAGTVESAREIRQGICARFIAANDLRNAFRPVDPAGELTPPVPVEKPAG